MDYNKRVFLYAFLFIVCLLAGSSLVGCKKMNPCNPNDAAKKESWAKRHAPLLAAVNFPGSMKLCWGGKGKIGFAHSNVGKAYQDTVNHFKSQGYGVGSQSPKKHEASFSKGSWKKASKLISNEYLAKNPKIKWALAFTVSLASNPILKDEKNGGPVQGRVKPYYLHYECQRDSDCGKGETCKVPEGGTKKYCFRP